MRPDVIDLRQFYATPRGQLARRHLTRSIREIWPDTRGMTVLGLGYAIPYLRPFRDDDARVVAVMPAQQGVIHWPTDGRGLVALAEDAELPFADNSVDRVLLVHELENSEEVRTLLREVWRVLAAGGRVLLVVPNRMGLWARFEDNPFGHGSPYSAAQLSRLLRDNLFSPRQILPGLMMPPFRLRMALRLSGWLERAGARWWPRLAGVHLVEAEKQVYSVTPVPVRARRRRLVPQLLPAPASRRQPDITVPAPPSR